MHPIVFEWGPIRIGSYGICLAMAFLGSILITNREFRKNKADVNLAWDIYLMAMVGGIVGSRILFIVEDWHSFVHAPLKVLFSASGFSVIGGYVLALTMCIIRLRVAREPFMKMADLCSPGMAIGYAVGRVGCITAGDGCYGLPTTGPLGMTFPHGLVPTLSSMNHLLSIKFVECYPGLPVPADIAVHPTPLYESLSMWLLLFVLLKGNWSIGPGRRFAMFLGWFGLSRFLIEFIRLNPPGPYGLTSDQWLSLFIIMGAIGVAVLARRFEATPEAGQPTAIS